MQCGESLPASEAGSDAPTMVSARMEDSETMVIISDAALSEGMNSPDTPETRPIDYRSDSRRSSSSSSSSPTSGGSPVDDQEMVPGTLLAGRYRIVAPLGRGGMGRVYRAEDLKLGQTVALKFLPRSLTNDPAWLGRFFAEVRLSREVTHPNVCRVHDIVETTSEDGATLHFLSMEYVDGENLAALLQRFGRLPTEKALEMSGQIAAGLAAAHAKGVLHRDLKPANVMVDGKGQAKITDFGLAVVADDAARAAEIAGTPGYMAPELLTGAGSTGRSDIYALGLVLYELLTGRQAFRAREGRQAKEVASPLRKYAPEVPADVERVILRCVEKDPNLRPASAREVLAVLPVMDQMEAALARGETPSPEMVAAAGTDEPMPLWKAWSLVAAIVVFLLGAWLLAPRSSLLAIATPNLSPAVLEHQAQELVRQLGYPTTVYNANWMELNYGMLRYKALHKTRSYLYDIAHAEQGPLLYNYRQGETESMVPSHNEATQSNDPPETKVGMLSVRMDSDGRLLRFRRVPEQEEKSQSTSAAPDWSPVLKAAGLDPGLMHPATAAWAPPDAFDVRQAWTGTYPNHPGTTIQVVAASRHGKISYFIVQAPWSPPEVSRLPGATAAEWVQVLLILGFVVGGIILVRRNLRLQRGDRASAFRLAGIYGVVYFVGIFLLAVRPEGPGPFLNWSLRQAAIALLKSSWVWIGYLGIEPFARKRMPHLLVSSTRLLGGRWRDVQVGRDILYGVLLAAFFRIEAALVNLYLLPHVSGETPEVPGATQLGLAGILSRCCECFGNAVLSILVLLAMFVVYRSLLRKPWLAIAAFFITMSLLNIQNENIRFELPLNLIISAILVAFIVRCGLVAGASFLFAQGMLSSMPWTHDLSNWTTQYYIVPGLVLLLLIAWGLTSAIGDQKLLGSFSLEE
jgi:serine/threonine protein kinase